MGANNRKASLFFSIQCFAQQRTGQRHLVCRRKLAEGDPSLRVRCESSIHQRFTTVYRVAFSVNGP